MRVTTLIALAGMLCAIAPTEAEAHRRHHRRIHQSHTERGGGLRAGPCTIGEHDTDGDGTLSDEEIAAARDARKATILAEFDADGSGDLSEEERAAARAAREAAREARRAERIAQHDTDNDGELSDAEREAAKAAREAALLEEFDADGSGDLDAAEREAARSARCAAKEIDEEEDEGEELVLALAFSLDFVRGDANYDGAVNIGDPVSVLNFLFLGGDTPSCFDAADSNDDGDIDVGDATTTLGALFLGTGPLPAPVEEPGFDPTIDDLTCDGVLLSTP